MASPVFVFGASAGNKTSNVSLGLTFPSRTWAVGDLLVAHIAMDPTSGTVGFGGASSGASPTNFGAWSANVDVTQGSGTSGVRSVVAWCRCTTAFTSSFSVNFYYPTTTAKAVMASAVTGCDGTNPVRGSNTISSASYASNIGAAVTVTAGGNFDGTAIAFSGCEGPSGSSCVFSGGSWTFVSNGSTSVGTSGSGSASNISSTYFVSSNSNVAAGNSTGSMGGGISAAAAAICVLVFSSPVAGGGITLPGCVQVKQGSSATSSLSITLDSNTGALNTLIVVAAASGSSNNPTAISCTLGGVTDNFVQDSAFGSSSDAAIGAVWRDSSCAGGNTVIAITATGGSGTIAIMATVFECNDIAVNPFDKTANSVSAGATSWTSTATPTTTQATERLFGGVFCTQNSQPTITGPSSPWSNAPQINQTQASFLDAWMAGVQDVSATGAYTYNGTVSPSSQWISKIATYKLVVAGGGGILPQQAKKRMPAYFTRINTPSRSGGVYAR
ncbi:MAG TPA: hypothetical protein VH593_15140 [Ktedonobacteraceae bacterium]